jgi:gliding motility-associated-like protein
VNLDDNGIANITINDINNGSSDACGTALFVASQTTFNCDDVGRPNNVKLTVTDNSNNTNTCIAEVTVIDNTNPIARCKSDTVYLDNLGNGSIDPTALNNGSYDVCPLSFSTLDTTLKCTDVGVKEVTLTVKDNSNNTHTCTAKVTVLDTIKPAARSKKDTVYLGENGIAILNVNDINNGSNDACGIASFNASKTNFSCNDIGTNTVMLTVHDESGNTADRPAEVIVLDTIKQIAICTPIKVYLDQTGNFGIDPIALNNGSSDFCGSVSFSASQTIFSCNDIGPAKDVTLTVRDSSGNTRSCIAKVTVVDSIPPVAICKDLTVSLDQAGDGVIRTSDLDNESSDACGIRSFMASDTTFRCADIGSADNDVTLIFTDHYGNTNTCTSELTVLDVMPPITNSKPITVYLDANGIVSIHPSDLNDGSTDACGIASFATSDSTFTCAEVGENRVNLTVSDINGNTSSRVDIVTVVDNIRPIASCKNDTVYLNIVGMVSIDPISLDNGSSDACGIASFATSDTTFTCAEVGENSIILTVTDNNNNVSYCISKVEVVDSIKPIVDCKKDTIYLDANGSASLNVSDINNESNDACGLISLEASQTTFTCTNIGPNDVTLTVSDNNGNVDSCITSVLVVDSINPAINCENSTEYLDQDCQFIVPDYLVLNNLIDNCNTSTVTITQAPPEGTVFDTLGNQNITILVTDNSGNIDSCNFTITLTDRDAPEIYCPGNQEVTTNYTCVYKIEDYTSLVTNELDNCDFNDVVLTQFPRVGTMVGGELINGSEDVAQTRVTMVLEDQSGNKDSCDFIVDVTCLSAIVIPEFISPNGDGVNDYFFLEGLERYPKNLLLIYNRWGDVVYEASPYSNTWEGQSNKSFHGDVLSGGSYFYSFQTKPGEIPFTGYIILKR